MMCSTDGVHLHKTRASGGDGMTSMRVVATALVTRAVASRARATRPTPLPGGVGRGGYAPRRSVLPLPAGRTGVALQSRCAPGHESVTPTGDRDDQREPHQPRRPGPDQPPWVSGRRGPTGPSVPLSMNTGTWPCRVDGRTAPPGWGGRPPAPWSARVSAPRTDQGSTSRGG